MLFMQNKRDSKPLFITFACYGSSGMRTDWVATRSRMGTYQGITDHSSPKHHYRHISQLMTSMRRRAPGKVCDVAACSNRIDTGGAGCRYRTQRCDRRRTTGGRRPLHRCCRSSPTSCGRRGESVLALDRRPTDRAQASWCECARAAAQAGSTAGGYSQRVCSTLGASAAAGGGGASAQSSRHG